MAYLLRTPTGLNSTVSLSSSINLFSNVGDYLEIRCSIRNTNGQSIVGINNSFDDFIQMQTSRIRMRMAPANLDFSTNYTMPSPDAEFILRFERVSSIQIQGFLDGESIGVVTSTDSLNFNQLLRSQNDSVGRFEGDVYYIKGSFNGGVSDTFNYNKQTLSGSNDKTFPDTVGGNDGTLVNFQTDNSQWVFFDDGGGAAGVTADAAYTVTAPTFTSSASVTLPQPIADASFALAAPTFAASAGASLPQPTADGAFSIASPSFSASTTATLPQPIADVAFTLNAPTFSATAEATIPGFNASVSYTVNAPTFAADAAVTLPSPTADVSYTIAPPTFSVSGEATLPQPSANAAFSVGKPTFAASATATEPGFNASVNFALPSPTFSVDATATLPQPIADGHFTITAPTFSVVAIVGGIAIIVDDETNINLPALSNNATVPALSTNVDVPALSNNVRI